MTRKHFQTKSHIGSTDNTVFPWEGIAFVLSALLSATTLGPVPVHAQCQFNWSTSPNSAAGHRPRALAAGDFNGDGVIDLASASFSNNSVSILLGNNNGGFNAAATYPIGAGSTNPISMVVDDFDNDGALDIAVVCMNATGVFILLGNGNGTFDAPIPYATSFGSTSIVKADFNQDGRIDLAIVNRNPNQNNNTVSILIGNNDNPMTLFFSPQVQSPFIPQAYALCVGDFNNDSKSDLAVLQTLPPESCCSPTTSFTILLGTGLGGLSSAGGQSVASGRSGAIAASDLNGDGYSDLVFSHTDGNSVRVWMNAGGSMKETAAYFAGSAPGWDSSALAVVDVDGNGTQDVLVANNGSSSVRLLRGTGTGTLVNAGAPMVGLEPTSIVVADLNGDQEKDIVVANGSTNTTVSVLLNASENSPIMTLQPNNQLAWVGQSRQLKVAATNAQNYQWRLNNIPLSDGNGYAGANTAQLTIGPAAFAHSGSYDCVIGNTCGTVTSAAATLDVLLPCLGDFNHDGMFNGQDLQTVVDLLLAGDTCLPCK
ncbi:FG-GAP repeat protein [Phycisphaerae bacterium RAS2]|nr:FG-GAP repeat protein [Phycisphaerae bacterium RAS2]